MRELSENKTSIPSPIEMEALSEIKHILRELPEFTDNCETEFWQRIRTWQETPYTPHQQAVRSILSFVGWWVAGTIGIHYTVMGWFISLFPAPWHSIVVSGILSLIAVSTVAHRERSHKQ